MTHTTVRTPACAHPADGPGEVGELVGVGLPGVVLRLPGRVDHDRVERQRVACVALEVVQDVALVGVDVAALPVPVRPFGQQRRQPAELAGSGAAARRARGRRTGAAAAARRRSARTPPGAGRGRTARRRPRSPATARSRARRSGTARARSRPSGSRPPRACPAGSRDRCSGGRPPAHARRPDWSKVCPWRAPSPVKRSPGRASHSTPSRSGSPSARASMVRWAPSWAMVTSTSPARYRPGPTASACSQPAHRVDLLVVEHALGDLHELVGRAPLGDPEAEVGDQAAPVAGDGQREGVERNADRDHAPFFACAGGTPVTIA